MILIDTHAHTYLKEFDEDRKPSIENAISAGVRKILLPNIDSTSIDDMLKLSSEFPDVCLPMMGLHPTSVDENYEKELNLVETWLKKQKFIAIGEIGMDLYWDKTFVEQQKICFKRQLQLANEYNLPTAIHIRKAFDETFAVLKEMNQSKFRGVFHCFGGDLRQAQKAIEAGFYLGIGGVVTYKNAGLQEVIKEIPLEKLVLETDAPFLTPVPHRGKRNESAYLQNIAEKIAEIKNVSVQKVGEITSENAKILFKI